jgi:hypothetical protein
MSKLVIATRIRLDRSAGLRLALLSVLSCVLGIMFLAMLVADEARAVSF